MQDTGLIADDTVLRAKIKQSSGPWWEEIFKARDDKKKPEVEYSPGAGDHVFKHNGKTMWAAHSTGKTLITGWERQPTQQEEIVIRTWGTDTAPIKDFIDKCVEHCMEKDAGKVGIYELHRWGLGWTKVQGKRPRPLESVILDKDTAQELLEDVKHFQNSAEWYISKGIPYRRGYLLYGPPGTGKTSFTLAVAGALKLNICYLNLSGNQLDDDGLNRALNQAPSHSIILLEDIDAIFRKREQVGRRGGGRQASFSGLLNALDGVRSQEGRILVMSTNHRERLDPALIRPGRCDKHLELCNATFSMIRQLFLKFFPGEMTLADEFAKRLPDRKLSMAKLQGHFLKYRDGAQRALDMHAELVKDTESVAEMTVAEWLDRLNLSKYLAMFTKNQAYLVSELHLHLHMHDKSRLNDNFKFKDKLDEQRVKLMISRQTEDKADFQYVTPQQARRKIQKFVKNEAICNKLVAAIPEDTMTGF
jgi:chaperone BCS1